jgi:4-amino-4-deoxy-L-arabinose transferase-like glycosyltransferase
VTVGRAHAALLAGFALLLLATALRPVDTPDWREADIASIARNFWRESMNPLAPRIDWRGDSSGVTEMEPPLLPYAMALLTPLFGEDARVGRLLSLAASLGAFAFFLALARERLGPAGSAAAGLAYALNPLMLHTATELRPEPWMLLGYVASVRYGERWLRLGARGDRARALLATSFAVFAKLPALHLGLLYAALALRRRGLRALRDRELWGFAALALLPAALWYGYARSVWHATGRSMGLSNQDHLFGLDLFAQRRPWQGLLDTELEWVFMEAGVALVALGALAGAWRRWRELELPWLGALALYFTASAATAGDPWATYYHVVAVPLAALLLGGSLEALWALAPARRGARTLARAGAAALLLAALFEAARESAPIAARRLPGASPPHPLQLCAQRFAELVPPETRVLVSAGRCRDRAGRRTSHNRPYLFYWMDRKGFQLCAEELSLEALDGVAARGAQFFVAERRDLLLPPGFEAALRARHAVVAECDLALLLRLDARSPGAPGRG